MYEIWADDQLIYSDVTPLETVKVVNPKLTLADSAAGQLDMSLPPTNVGYESIKRMVTDITVKTDGQWLWSGRVLQDAYDFWNNRKMICEGEIAFLNDSIQPPAKYDVTNDHTTIDSFLRTLIDIHNQQVGPNRQFIVGDVLVTDGDMQDGNDEIYRYTNYETTLECVNDKLLSRLGGHLRVKHEIRDGKEVRVLDYIRDEDLPGNNQVVRFGVNLLDYSKNVDMSQLSTAIVPRGHRLEDESDVEIEGLEPYLTVKTLNPGERKEKITVDGVEREDVWHEDGSMFVKNPVAIENFGWICAVVDWDAVTVDENLYTKAVKYLKDEQYEKMTLEIKAIDLKYMGYDANLIKFLSKLHCISEPHGMDHTFTVSKIEIDLSNPANSMYTLGTDVQLSLTQATTRINSEVLGKIDSMPSKSEILNAAKENAFQMLLGGTGGYVRFNRRNEEVIDPVTGDIVNDGSKPNVIYEIIISDGPTDEASLHKWVWNEAGLGHLHRDNYQADWTKSVYEDEDGTEIDVAITKDGKIVANAITAGVLEGILIKGVRFENDGNSGYIKSTQTDGHGNKVSEVRISGGSLVVDVGGGRYVQFNSYEDNGGHYSAEPYHVDFSGSRWGCYSKFYNDTWGWMWFDPADLFKLVSYWKDHGGWSNS